MIVHHLKTALFIGTLTGLIMLFGGIFGGQDGIIFAAFFAIFFNACAYFFSDKIVLRLYKAEPLDKVEFGWIYALVDDLARDMRLPQPRLWLIKTPVANAFATGRSPSHASVAVTTGILQLLDRHELRGVLAHELSHIKNRDILVSTIAATLAAIISSLANMAQHALFWRAATGNNRSQRSSSVHPFVLLITSIVVPVVASLIQLAVSRSREYLADETGACASRDPLALASALEKLHNHTRQAHFNEHDTTKTTTAHLFIVNPFLGGAVSHLLSTHPPLQERIKRLRNLCEKKPYQRSVYEL